jgi:hypothetical protein
MIREGSVTLGFTVAEDRPRAIPEMEPPEPESFLRPAAPQAYRRHWSTVLRRRERVAARQWLGPGLGLLGAALALAGKLGQAPGSVVQFMAAGPATAPFAFWLAGMQVDWTGEFVFALFWLVPVLW